MSLKKTLFAALLVVTIGTFASRLAQAGIRVGGPAPDFTLPQASDGKPVGLKPLLEKNKAVVVLFIAVKCPYSNGYNERMATLAREYAKRGVALVGINSNKTEPAADVARHAETNHFGFAVVKDDGAKVANLYGAQHTPEAFLVDAKGNLIYHGRIDDSYDDPAKVKAPDLRNALDAVVAGTTIMTAETKAFGCSIKR